MEFSTIDLAEKYDKVVDVKITSYDDDLDEKSILTDDDYDPEMLEEILEYCKSYDNVLDTNESRIYKKSLLLGTPSNLLYINTEGEIIEVLKQFNPLEYPKLSDLRELFKDMRTFMSFDDFVEGSIWESEDPDTILYLYNINNPDFDPTDYEREYWDKKIDNWKKDDAEKLESIYWRQMDLLRYTIQSNINVNFEKREYMITNRVLTFNVKENVQTMTSASIYDKFIFSEPTSKIPFIKLSLYGDKDIYNIFTKSTRMDINGWLIKDEKIEEDSPYPNEDYIYFLIKLEDLEPMACYLSLTKMEINIPSSYSINVLETLIRNEILDTFVVDIFDMKEKSVEMETILNLQHIEPVYLQFFLASNPQASLYIDESAKEFSSVTRIVRLYYKPVSDYDIQKYVVKYERSNASVFNIQGPNEKDCLNFLVNIFGRTIQGFFLRQNAIGSLFSQILPIGEINDDLKEKNTKKKKNTSILDPHLYTKKTRLDLIKSLINVDKGYSTYCQCQKQPNILTDEEVSAWLETDATIYNKTYSDKIQKKIASFTMKDGKVLNFACPNDKYPEIYLTKETKNVNKEYSLLPCCRFKKRPDTIDPNLIVLNNKTDTGNTKAVKTYSIANIDESVENKIKPIFISQELNHLLQYLNESNDKIDIIKPSTKVSKNSFLEAVLIGIDNNDYTAHDYRGVIYDSINPMVVSQEALGIDQTSECLMDNFKNPKKCMDSIVHYRILEEYFKIHIFVFTMPTTDLKLENMEYNIEMETPAHKIFPIRTLYRDRPCVILVKANGEYNTIVHGKNVGKFSPEMSVKMMELFNYTHETSSSYSSNTMVKNLFSRVNWENFFKDDPIIYQEIDIAGKARIVQLKSGMTISIPPTQPFNVSLIPEYYTTPLEETIERFGEPNAWDCRGVWYSLMGIPNLFYVLTGEHGLGKMNEITEVPLNSFRPTVKKYAELMSYRDIKRATYALIQIIQWGWRIDSRPDFNTWFRNHISIISEPEDYNDILPFDIHVSLPEPKSVNYGFRRIHEWWPQMFTSGGKITLWSSLIRRIEMFFVREQEIMGNTTFDPIQHSLVGFYEVSEDYPASDNTRVFVGGDSFKNWARVDRKREENPEIKVHGTLSDRCINNIIQKDVPIRVFYKNHHLIVQNLKERTLESAVKNAYYWQLYRKRLLDENFKTPSKDKYQIVTLAFSKKYDLVEIDSIGKGIIIYILRYPDGSYATIYNN